MMGSECAQADPGYYVTRAYGSENELALDLRYWTVKPPGESATLWPEVGIRWGVTSRWTSEVLASFIGSSMGDQTLSSWNWQNTYLLTQGQYPIDLAIYAKAIHNAGQGNAIEVGPVLQAELGTVEVNFNPVLEHGPATVGGPELKYQWQALQRVRPGLRLGLQGFGEVGRWNHPSNDQSHRAGPALRINAGSKTEFQAAYLWGRTFGSRGDMFSAQLVQAF